MGKPLDAYPGETMEGVGWVTQVQLEPPPGKAFDPSEWYSWTQWKDRERALEHAAALLRDHPERIRARVVRVDWTVVEVIER